MAALTQTKKEEVSLKLKLVVNKESNKVIYAEAGKDFVDVLFSFLTLPLGTIARLVEKESNMGPVTIGCLNSLYHSVADLDKDCFWNEEYKEMLLQPKNSSVDYCSSLELNIDDTKPRNYFTCSVCGYCTVRPETILPKSLSKGLVNFFATFLITDELIVKPNSLNCTSFDLLRNSGIKNTSSVKEMNVDATKEKVLDMLKCTLLSKTILTDLFLGKKPSIERSSFFPCDVENTSDIQIKLKLFLRKTDDKILFALGEQDFADLILSFLTFPLGGVVRKLKAKCSFGSINGLYNSIADLDENIYIMSKDAKDRLLDPHLASQFKFSRKIFPIQKEQPFDCYSCLWSDNPISSLGSLEGYVKGPRTYVVTDDLVFAKMSSISPLDILDHFGTPLCDLKEKFVTIGVIECLSILQASLISTSALTIGLRHLLTEVKKEK